jgi:hypothetical protein
VIGIQGNGAPGITIGDWLIDQGLEAPKAPRVRSGVGAIRHQQRQSMAMRSTGAGMGSRGGGQAVVSPSMGISSKQVGTSVHSTAREETALTRPFAPRKVPTSGLGGGDTMVLKHPVSHFTMGNFVIIHTKCSLQC